MHGIFNMKNLNVLAKSRGVVLFAFNTTAVDYVQIADQAARLVHHTLNLPVTLITDHNAVTSHIDHTVVVENTLQNVRKGYANLTQWRNGDRYQAYALSPYDETILIDSDYLMLDRSLLTLLDACSDYNIMHTNRYLTKQSQQLIDTTSIDQVWATAVVFKRTNKAQQLFDLVGRIQRNYDYYRKLYNIRATNFRNDFAFAVANNIVNGYAQANMIPWSMLTAENPITGIERMNNSLIVREETKAHVIPQQNLHIIDKDYLTSPKFELFVDSLCQE
jgi:hypothetical protein